MTVHTLATRPLSPAVGEELLDLDLSRSLSDSTVHAIKALLGERGVVVARRQQLTPDLLISEQI